MLSLGAEERLSATTLLVASFSSFVAGVACFTGAFTDVFATTPPLEPGSILPLTFSPYPFIPSPTPVIAPAIPIHQPRQQRTRSSALSKFSGDGKGQTVRTISYSATGTFDYGAGGTYGVAGESADGLDACCLARGGFG
jgi:hypothetical protein